MLLSTFDRHKSWAQDGRRNCVAWLNAYCGMSLSAGNDRLRSAYALENLPLIRRLFELGELSGSKERALTRIATPDNGELPTRAITVNCADGQSMEFTAPMKRFKVRRSDGSLIG